MPAPSPAVRRTSFALFVRRAVAHAAVTRQWSVSDIAAASGGRVSKATINRWQAGTWKRSPQPDQIEAFCDALGIEASTGLAVLWPGKHAKPAPTPPFPDPEVAALLQVVQHRLADPRVSDEEKFLIRATIRGLVARSARRTDSA